MKAYILLCLVPFAFCNTPTNAGNLALGILEGYARGIGGPAFQRCFAEVSSFSNTLNGVIHGDKNMNFDTIMELVKVGAVIPIDCIRAGIRMEQSIVKLAESFTSPNIGWILTAATNAPLVYQLIDATIYNFQYSTSTYRFAGYWVGQAVYTFFSTFIYEEPMPGFRIGSVYDGILGAISDFSIYAYKGVHPNVDEVPTAILYNYGYFGVDLVKAFKMDLGANIAETIFQFYSLGRDAFGMYQDYTYYLFFYKCIQNLINSPGDFFLNNFKSYYGRFIRDIGFGIYHYKYAYDLAAYPTDALLAVFFSDSPDVNPPDPTPQLIQIRSHSHEL
eukprot:TRINITY_DN38331_c0_g1_i1.p1 TRINITY_DN38331_c0_g1~~TRINITY_DN38331_c0_g1_i1.p1  ORF type:complete len:332 (-),score=41.31 TRINITY_DN38331_c0_g1_i1:21-1016(-)